MCLLCKATWPIHRAKSRGYGDRRGKRETPSGNALFRRKCMTAISRGDLARTTVEPSWNGALATSKRPLRRIRHLRPLTLGLQPCTISSARYFVGAPPFEARLRQTSAAQRHWSLILETPKPMSCLVTCVAAGWQWANAEAEYKRALDLAPNDPAAVLGLALWLHCQGREEEAVTLSRHASELDPFGTPSTKHRAHSVESPDYRGSIQSMRSVLALHPDDAGALWYFGLCIGPERVKLTRMARQRHCLLLAPLAMQPKGKPETAAGSLGARSSALLYSASALAHCQRRCNT